MSHPVLRGFCVHSVHRDWPLSLKGQLMNLKLDLFRGPGLWLGLVDPHLDMSSLVLPALIPLCFSFLRCSPLFLDGSPSLDERNAREQAKYEDDDSDEAEENLGTDLLHKVFPRLLGHILEPLLCLFAHILNHISHTVLDVIKYRPLSARLLVVSSVTGYSAFSIQGIGSELLSALDVLEDESNQNYGLLGL